MKRQPMRQVATCCGRLAVTLALFVAAAVPTVQAGSRWGKSYLPNVEVLDQDGRPLRFYDDLIKDRITIFSFIYTSCSTICPLTLARLREVQENLGDAMGKSIFFVSVSIDPIPDTPAKLKEYAAAYKVGPGWTFVTGDPGSIDLIRYKLGERSGQGIAQHKNEALMYNDKTGEWSRNSVFADLGVLTMDIQNMDPVWRQSQSAAADRAMANGSNKSTLATAAGLHDRPGQALFIKACAACHTVGGGDKVGPDLSGLTTRRNNAWISRYMMEPEKVRADNDPIALQLRQRFPAVYMPRLGISEADASDLISYIESAKPPRVAGQTNSETAISE